MQAEEQVVLHHLTLYTIDSAVDIRIQPHVQTAVPQLLQCVVVLQDPLNGITSAQSSVYDRILEYQH